MARLKYIIWRNKMLVLYKLFGRADVSDHLKTGLLPGNEAWLRERALPPQAAMPAILKCCRGKIENCEEVN